MKTSLGLKLDSRQDFTSWPWDVPHMMFWFRTKLAKELANIWAWGIHFLWVWQNLHGFGVYGCSIVVLVPEPRKSKTQGRIWLKTQAPNSKSPDQASSSVGLWESFLEVHSRTCSCRSCNKLINTFIPPHPKWSYFLIPALNSFLKKIHASVFWLLLWNLHISAGFIPIQASWCSSA